MHEAHMEMRVKCIEGAHGNEGDMHRGSSWGAAQGMIAWWHLTYE